MEQVKRTRPDVLDAREWRDFIVEALNEAEVHIGEEFVIKRFGRRKGAVRNPAEPKKGPYTRGSKTSKAAAGNAPKKGTQRARVLEFIVGTNDIGATRDEIAEILRLPDSGTDARVGELLDGGFIERTDRFRKTQFGSDAEVLVATPSGREWALGSQEAML